MVRNPHSQIGSTSPGQACVAVTPDNSNDLNVEARALYIGVAGDVAIHDRTGASVTFVGVPAGTILPVFVRRVLVTGTDATSIVAII